MNTHKRRQKNKTGKKSFAVFTTLLFMGLIGFVFISQTGAKTTIPGKYGETSLGTFAPGVIREITLEQKQEEIRLLQERKKANMEAAYFSTDQTAESIMNSEWAIMPEVASRGDVVLVRHNKPGKVSWQGKEYTLTSFGTGYYTYLPIPINLDSGSYSIGNKTLTIQDKTFETQYIQVSEENQNIARDTEQIMKDQAKIDKARSQSADEFLFPADSAFIKPIEGPVTTPFGYTRYINGEYSGSHTAIDWAAPTGTPVKATNDGVVALADNLHLTGNSVYIDHGMDMFSQYIHMSELNVEAGDKVEKGDIIGKVGSTGFSTGPHMHFTFWVHNVPVNPNLYLGTTPFQTDKQVE
ncbi:M23 family metallopeptidase [Pontibacillus sp. HMF3514]|uniref:M23 family metallopeptidase n=1 Tax=Pontibacillus sp. HMF3514 TaxID=2692425 RepID=UPI00272BD887|nr:M23 family metallopeptidase [Pontibacillus sp. HMF3514]